MIAENDTCAVHDKTPLVFQNTYRPVRLYDDGVCSLPWELGCPTYLRVYAADLPTGGRFKLCYCTDECDTKEGFRVTTGMLVVLGPQPAADSHMCVSGQVCAVEFDGIALEGNDALAAMDTCGVGSMWTLGPSEPSVGNAEGTKLTFLWENSVLSLGGIFRMCWCPEECDNTLAEYPLDVGLGGNATWSRLAISSSQGTIDL